MWALPCDVYDLEPRSCYENEEPVLACRETVSRAGIVKALEFRLMLSTVSEPRVTLWY
jgi:hypothetical protein